MRSTGQRRFKVVLIKPSHYDDDGYVIQWWRSFIPSNSLASVYSLLAQCAADQLLGADIAIDVEAYDEGNTLIDVKRAIRRIRRAGQGFVGLVGVQSNQFPRALDLARQFRAAGIPVVIGGFHISGCLAMLDDMQPDVQAALDMGCILFAGEAEGRMAGVIRDIAAGTPRPVYNHLDDLPDLANATRPLLPRDVITRVFGHYTSFDAGRGCPFQCSFCTIINVQGRKSRRRTPDDIEQIVRANAKQGITRFFVTDDNFARNRDWEPILDRLIALRQEGMKIKLILQVDTLCHKIPGFVAKAAKAGCNNVFIGLENINPAALAGVKKKQNRIWEYREMLQAWKHARVMTYAGYIIGFPNNTPESIIRDIETIQRELPIDLLEFMILTPLPGCEDHKNLYLKQVPMDPGMNKYDLEHVTTAHPLMSAQELADVYQHAWRHYYNDRHIETILRRAIATGFNPKKMADMLTLFSGAVRYESVHTLQVGVMRRKVRTQRRQGMPIESTLTFYPRRFAEMASGVAAWASMAWRYRRILRRVMSDPDRLSYVDEALRAGEGEQAEFVHAVASQLTSMQRAAVRTLAAE
ncbi:MAG TPA: radical SAM protein [Acetobacteraceae bacterium]